MANTNRVTIKEIAHEAGVSKQTVSRVLNNRADVAPETRRRVQAIIERQGYQPSNLARSLIRGRSYTIGVISSNLQNFGPSQVLIGVEKQANELGYTLTLNLIHEPEMADIEPMLRNMLAHHVDGVVWTAVSKVGDIQRRILQELAKLATPAVAIAAESQPGLTVVQVDNFLGGKLAAQHLIEQGYRTIGIITGPTNEWSAMQRLLGWQHGCRARGLLTDNSLEETLVVAGDWSAASGDCGLRQLLAQRPDIEALFVSNDQMALGVLKAAQDLGRRVPQDLGIVGFDDIPEAGFFTPPLTTIRQDLVRSGCLAVRELDRAIRADTQGQPFSPETIVIAPQLIIRESSTMVKMSAEQIEKGAMLSN